VKKSRFTEEKIAYALKAEVGGGKTFAKFCHRSRNELIKKAN